MEIMEIRKGKDNDMAKFTMDNIKLSAANRDVNQKQVDKLKESIRQRGYIKGLPILVEQDGYIVDGQHRFLACKQLGIEATIIEVSSFDLAPIINSMQSRWSLQDYVKYYAEKNIEDYIILERICKSKNISVSTAAAIITGKWASKSSIKKGERNPIKEGVFRIPDKSDKGLAKLDRKIEAIMHLISVLHLPKTDRLVLAVTRLSNDSNFSFKIMLSKIEYQRARIYRCSTIQEYMQMLANIYNNKNSKKVTV